MRRAPLALLTAFLIAALCGVLAAQTPAEDDLEVREYDHLVLKDNPDKVFKGSFRRDEDNKFEVTPKGKWIFDVQEGDSRNITLKVSPGEVQIYKVMQSEEDVWRKEVKNLPTGRLDLPQYFEWSDKCVEKGYLALAEEILRQALAKIDDRNVEVYFKLGDLLRRQFQFNAELDLYQEGLGKKILKSERIMARMAGLLALLGLHSEAEKTYLQALDKEPRHADSLLGLGRLYLSRRRFNEAEARLKRAEEIAGIDEVRGPVLKWLGVAYLKTGKTDLARKSLEEGAGLLTGDGEIVNLLGTVYYFSGEWARAKEKFMEVLGINPEDLVLPGGSGEGEPWGEDGEGGSEGGEESGEDEGADEGAEEEGADQKGDPWGPSTEFDPLKSKAYCNLSLCLIREDSLDQAERYLQLAAGVDPTSAFPWVVLGYLRERQARFYEAREAYLKALTISPFDPEAHYALGVLNLRAGDSTRAREEFIAAIDGDPDFSDALAKLGRLALQDGRASDGVLYFRRALSLCPGVADWRILLGIGFAMRNEYGKAEEQFSKAVDLNPAHPIAKAASLFSLYNKPGSGNDEEAFLKIKEELDERAEALTEPVKAYLKELILLIEENRGKVQWIDDFERPDSDEIARKWEPNVGLGPMTRIYKGRAAIEGTQLKSGETTLERPLPAEKFVRFEADVYTKFLSPTAAGVQVLYRIPVGGRAGEVRAGIRLGKDEKGRLVLWEFDPNAQKWREAQVFDNWPETDSGANRLGIGFIKVAEEEGSTRDVTKIVLTLNKAPLGEPYSSDRFSRGFRSGDIWVGVFAEADRGTDVKITTDNVRLVTWK